METGPANKYLCTYNLSKMPHTISYTSPYTPVQAKLDPHHIAIHREFSVLTVLTHVAALRCGDLHAVSVEGSRTLVTQEKRPSLESGHNSH